MALLRPSAAAAALQCSGGENGRTCGLKWTQRKTWDGTNGVGQQMAALEVVQSTLFSSKSKPPVTGDKGGTSTGDPGAGSNPKNNKKVLIGAAGRQPTNADRIGAAVLTAFVLLGVLVGTLWVNDGYEKARYLVGKFDATSLGIKLVELHRYFIPRG
jgi:mannan endo-1,6-alpha-mannosidase